MCAAPIPKKLGERRFRPAPPTCLSRRAGPPPSVLNVTETEQASYPFLFLFLPAR